MSDGDKQSGDAITRKRQSGKGVWVFLVLLAGIAGWSYWNSNRDEVEDELLAVPELSFDDDEFAEVSDDDADLPQNDGDSTDAGPTDEGGDRTEDDSGLADAGTLDDEKTPQEPIEVTEADDPEEVMETATAESDEPDTQQPADTDLVTILDDSDTDGAGEGAGETTNKLLQTKRLPAGDAEGGEQETPVEDDVADATDTLTDDSETLDETDATEQLSSQNADLVEDQVAVMETEQETPSERAQTDTALDNSQSTTSDAHEEEVATAAPANDAVETAKDSDAVVEEPIKEVPTSGEDASEAGESDVAEAASGAEEPASAPETQDESAAQLPEFDLVRIDKSGGGLVAGRAAPGTKVRVFADGQEIAVAESNASGEFVAFVQTPDGNEGRRLSLSALSAAGSTLNSADSVIVLPGEEGDDAAPAILKAAPEGVRVIQPLGLGKVHNVTLDVITYDEEGAVLLSGRAPKAQPIRIYVDRTPITDIKSTASGVWEARLPSIEEGRYVLRVDALRADGTVESRAESPFQRVFPTAKAQLLSQVTVQPGNTLWVMAQERYGDGFRYSQIFAANKDLIRDPDLIYPGQIFALPEE